MYLTTMTVDVPNQSPDLGTIDVVIQKEVIMKASITTLVNLNSQPQAIDTGEESSNSQKKANLTQPRGHHLTTSTFLKPKRST